MIEPEALWVEDVHVTGPVVWVPSVYPPPKVPLAPEVESTEKVSPAPVMDSVSEMTAVAFFTTPLCWTLADAVAVVFPGIGTPVTRSV